jgi:hypothetical protein
VSTETERPQIADLLHEDIAPYAEELRRHGFTVYAHDPVPYFVRADGSFAKSRWFVYSRDVEGHTCYGHLNMSHFPMFEPPTHTMPTRGTREHGNAVIVAEADVLPWDSVEAAEVIARPENRGRYIGGVVKQNRGDDYWIGTGRTIVFEPVER